MFIFILAKWVVVHLSLKLFLFTPNSFVTFSLLALFFIFDLLLPQIKILTLCILLISLIASKVEIATSR